MKHLNEVFVFICALILVPKVVSAQVDMQRVLDWYGNVEAAACCRVLDSLISANKGDYPEWQLSKYKRAKAKYDEVIMLHVEIDWDHYLETKEVVLLPEKSSAPYDALFFKGDEIKFYVETLNGKVEDVSDMPDFKSAHKARVSVMKKIKAMNPDYLFVSRMLTSSYFFVLGGKVYIYRYFDGEFFELEEFIEKHKGMVQVDINLFHIYEALPEAKYRRSVVTI